MSITRALPVFGVGFAAIYVLTFFFDIALVTYHPAIHEWDWFAVKPKAGPAMYWYGQLATSALGALVITLAASLAPARWRARLWSGWAWLVPLCAAIIMLFILRNYFIR